MKKRRVKAAENFKAPQRPMKKKEPITKRIGKNRRTGGQEDNWEGGAKLFAKALRKRDLGHAKKSKKERDGGEKEREKKTIRKRKEKKSQKKKRELKPYWEGLGK